VLHEDAEPDVGQAPGGAAAAMDVVAPSIAPVALAAPVVAAAPIAPVGQVAQAAVVTNDAAISPVGQAPDNIYPLQVMEVSY